ncbi:MAG: hypothetical protein NT027_16625 [Proteobacteria bacterium]|nr:hypothetical protein [Pseudomonadota bacterium]
MTLKVSSRYFKAGVAVGLMTVLAISACKTTSKKGASDLLGINDNDGGNASAVDMNDLSFLFTKDSSNTFYPLIQISKPWEYQEESLNPSQNPILPQSIYQNLLDNSIRFGQAANLASQAGVPNADDGFKYDDWMVTSFRIDPCAPSLAMDAGRGIPPGANAATATAAKALIAGVFGAPSPNVLTCVVQIRLIVQPQIAGSNFTRADESSVHLVFRLNGDSRAFSSNGIVGQELATDILELKRSSPAPTTAVPLQEHPGLVAEASTTSNSDGPFAKRVINFLSKYLSGTIPANIAVIRTFRGTTNNKVDLMFAGGTNATGVFQAAPMPTNRIAPTTFFEVSSGSDRSDWTITPIPEQKESLADLMVKKRLQFSPSHLASFMQFDNPEITHFFGTDCLSCHGTSQMAKEANIHQHPNLAAVTTRYQSPAGVTGYPLRRYLPESAQQRNGIVVRNFGWADNMPIIGLRSVTETASVVDYMNHNVLGVPNPGYNCGANEPAVWANALRNDSYDVKSGSQQNRIQLKQTLFAQCGVAPVQPIARIAANAQGSGAPSQGPLTTTKALRFNPSSLYGRTFSGTDNQNITRSITFNAPSNGVQTATHKGQANTQESTWEVVQPNSLVLTLKSTGGNRYYTIVNGNQICFNGDLPTAKVTSSCLSSTGGGAATDSGSSGQTGSTSVNFTGTYTSPEGRALRFTGANTLVNVGLQKSTNGTWTFDASTNVLTVTLLDSTNNINKYNYTPATDTLCFIGGTCMTKK